MKLLHLLIVVLLSTFFTFAQSSGDSTVTITHPNADSLFYFYQNVSCPNQSDGEISILVYGDNGPYSYEWGASGNISPTNNIDTLDAGTYTITIYDNTLSGIWAVTIPITEPPQVSNFGTITNPRCFDDANGSISISTASGDGPFDYLWRDENNNVVSGAQNLSNIPAGSYTLYTTDTYNCEYVDSFSLSNPLPITSDLTATPLSCINSCDGTAIANNIVGIPPFTFLWSDPSNQTTQTATDLCSGTYQLSITDDSLCVGNFEVFVPSPDTLQIASLEFDPSCYNSCDGEITVSLEGGSEPYTYNWFQNDILFDSLSSINNLCPDTFQLIFRDDLNCTDSISVIINERDSFQLIDNLSPISCFGDCNGAIDISHLNPDNTPISYDWSNGLQGLNIGNLCADTFALVITDSENCIDTFEYSLVEPSPIQIAIDSINQNLCHNDAQGFIELTISGGTPPFDYNWSNNTGFTSSNQDVFNLEANIYELSILDNRSCPKDTAFQITSPAPLNVAIAVDDVDCYSYATGEIQLTTNGGVTPYQYVWSTSISDSSNTLDSLIAGSYTVNIIDENNCTLDTLIEVSEPNRLAASPIVNHISCNGANDGSIQANPTGGVAPYFENYFGNNPLQLSAGNYPIQITDNNNCQFDTLISISEPLPITITPTTIDASCFGANDGSSTLGITGGTPSYQEDWNGENPQQLTAGSYQAYVYDNNNCVDSINITINQPTQIIISENIIPPSCAGYTDGVITPLIIGGNPPYTQDWGAIDPLNVAAGNYSLIVTDADNCQGVKSIDVTEPDPISFNYNLIPISCNGYSDGGIIINSISGGTGMMTEDFYGFDFTQLSAGTYIYSIDDINGCELDTIFIIDEPDPLQSQLFFASNHNGFNISCYNACDGILNANTLGGTPPYLVNWSNGSTGESINDACAGNIDYTVTDNNGCTFTIPTAVLTEPPLLIANVDVLSASSCYGICDASASVNSISGGVPPYSNLWLSNGLIDSLNTSLCAGEDSVLVTDDNNCVLALPLTLIEPDEIVANFSITPEYGQAPLNVEFTNNSQGANLFEWDFGDLSNIETNNAPYFEYNYNLFGEYLITLEAINDTTGCSQFYSLNLEVEGMVEIPNIISPNGDGVNDYLSFNSYGAEALSCSIYNRWGTLIYQLNHINDRWNGNTVTGENAPEGVYFYLLNVTGIHGSILEEKGSITIIR